MLYNVKIYEKRYKRKTKEQIIQVLTDNKLMIDQFAIESYNDIMRDIVCMNDTVSRYAFFDVYGKVIFSINKTKTKY
jgi:hypothetical protein